MEIGRWYKSQHMYTAAIGRFQRVVDDYQTTNQVPEAMPGWWRSTWSSA